MQRIFKTVHTIANKDIPLLCEYALFTNTGEYISGSLGPETARGSVDKLH